MPKSTAALTGRQIILQKKKSGVAIVLINASGKTNLLSSSVMEELGQTILATESDPEIKAIGIISGKPDAFVSGADLHEIIKCSSVSAAYKLSKQGQELFTIISTKHKPTVIGIHGACLGGGLELALCCDKRIATSSPLTILGLPEVKLGFIPGLGGTQRLPRLVGVKKALELILSGEPISSKTAKEIGLVDELVEPDVLLDELEALAIMLAQTNSSKTNNSEREQSTELTPEKTRSVFAALERSVRIKTKGNYPAHTRVLQVVEKGLTDGIDVGLEEEAKAFSELSQSGVSNNLVFLFFTEQMARQHASSLSSHNGNPSRTIGIIGGGTMGTSIAHLAMMNGFKVLFRAANEARQQQGLTTIMDMVKRSEKSRQDSESHVNLARLISVTNDEQLNESDLILEACAEDIEIKRSIFQKMSQFARPDCVIATNTSSLPLAEIASFVTDPTRTVGLHFFNPVDKMPLVEVISHHATSRDTWVIAAAFALSLGKTPVVVKDCPGFLMNRLLCCYLAQAARLAEEHVPLNWIEDAAIDFGMPMGPMALLDEIGLDVAFATADAIHKQMGERLAPPMVMKKSQSLNIIGKKSGSGIYLWDPSGKRLGFNPELSALGLIINQEKADKMLLKELADAMVLPMIDEAARCLTEKIVRRPREIDLSVVLGMGFPSFRGGVLRYADAIGIDNVILGLKKTYDHSHPKREICELLLTLETAGRSFYSRTPGKEGESSGARCGE